MSKFSKIDWASATRCGYARGQRCRPLQIDLSSFASAACRGNIRVQFVGHLWINCLEIILASTLIYDYLYSSNNIWAMIQNSEPKILRNNEPSCIRFAGNRELKVGLVARGFGYKLQGTTVHCRCICRKRSRFSRVEVQAFADVSGSFGSAACSCLLGNYSRQHYSTTNIWAMIRKGESKLLGNNKPKLLCK